MDKALEKQDELEQAVKRLIQGLMAGSAKITLEAHKQLYDAGSRAVPMLAGELDRWDVQKIAHPQAASVVVGLAALLHDLDERAARAFADRTLRSTCHPVIASGLRSLQRHAISNYRRSSFAGVCIFEETALDPDYEASRQIADWLTEVPQDDLQGLARIYIVKSKPHFDFYGKYLPILGVVTLAWHTFLGPRNPLNRLLLRHHKHTLFHEIGHHAHDHTEFGQDPEQEAEAETYARTRLARTDPIWFSFRRALKGLFG
ncbi:MAG: hypothetical protein ACR2PO_11305 [Methyloligellaceae bacterium]